MWVLLIPVALVFGIGLLIFSIISLIKGPKNPFFYGYAMVDTHDTIPDMWKVQINGGNIDITCDKKLLYSLDIKDVADVTRRYEKEPDKIIEKDKNLLLRAAAGGLIFGGAGAIVGAMSALKPSQKVVIKGKIKDTYILIVLRNGKRLVLKAPFGYEYAFNNFCAKFRTIQRLGVPEPPVA